MSSDGSNRQKRSLSSKRDETDNAIGHYSAAEIAAANHATEGQDHE